MAQDTITGIAFRCQAADGYGLGGFAWRHEEPSLTPRPVIIINAATSVRCQYYWRFADYLFGHGADVLIYDYRGIGTSAPPNLRRLTADWLTWGECDFEAILQYALLQFPGQPIRVVGHSVGGVLIGLAPSNTSIDRALTMGAQHAYWPDYLACVRWRMWAKWHVLMPAITRVMGYFPGKRLGWLEDTPAGVVQDWGAKQTRFVDTYRQPGGSCLLAPAVCDALQRRFASFKASLLAVSVSDDPYGTTPAIERLLQNFSGAPRWHLRLSAETMISNAPASKPIGHFAFFHQRFEHDLWPIARDWLLTEKLPDHPLGTLTPFADDHDIVPATRAQPML